MTELLLLVSIDVERDCGPNWRGSNPVTYLSVLEAIPGRLTQLFSEFAIRPTYLVSADVMDNKAATEILISLPGNYELGAHLHAEFLEPDAKFFGISYDGVYTSELQCHYPYNIEREKIRNLSKIFFKKFGVKPLSFRAGRYGIGVNTCRALLSEGFRVDTSLAPGIRLRYEVGEIDFTGAPQDPFFMDPQHFLKAGRSELLEIPITIHPKLGWLRPSLNNIERMVKIVKEATRRIDNNLPVVLNVMFHSQEFQPGASPFAATKGDCDVLADRLRKLFDYVCSKGARPLTLSEAWEAFFNKKHLFNSL